MTPGPAELQLPFVGYGSGIEPDERLSAQELQLALRSHAVPLAGPRYDVRTGRLHRLVAPFG